MLHLLVEPRRLPSDHHPQLPEVILQVKARGWEDGRYCGGRWLEFEKEARHLRAEKEDGEVGCKKHE
jgi:hypothetical protein